MNRAGPQSEAVRLSVGDWVRIATLVTALVAAAWKFTIDISSEIRVVQTRLQQIETRLDQLERQRRE